MKFKSAFTTFLLLCIVILSQAQNPTILTGKVIDENSGNGLSFVNIGIEGTLIGTASNSFGEFTLKTPEALKDKNLFFSAIGYQNYTMALSDFKDGAIIRLQELSYGIEDIEIKTQSQVLYRKVRETSDAISKQFINRAFSYQLLYRNEIYTNQELTRKRDALVLLADAKGYSNTKTAFADRNYKFENVQRNFDVNTLEKGTTLMNDLLVFDFARSGGNILETAYLYDYDLQLLDDVEINEQAVMVIAYRLANPNLTKTGDLYASSSEGKLYISKETNLLLKVESHIKASSDSKLGRNIASVKTKAAHEVDYHITTTYKNTDNGYCLDQIILNKSYVNEQQQTIRQNASLLVVKVAGANMSINTRQYFEDMVSDPDFWVSQKIE